jgi:hypothetical protein
MSTMFRFPLIQILKKLNMGAPNAQRCHWHRYDMHSGVIDTAVTLDLIFEWLLLPLKGISNEKTYQGKFTYTISITFTQKIWGLTKHRFDENRRFHSRFCPRIRSYIQKDFNPCIRGLGGVVWWKNQRSKISCQGPIKNAFCL